MLDEFLTRMREIILDSAQVLDDCIEMDIARAEEKGHDHMDIVIAENILLENIQFTTKFDEDIKYIFKNTDLNREPEFHPVVLYVPFVKILFVINTMEMVSTSIYEEEIIKEFAIRELVTKFMDTPFAKDDFIKKRVEFKWHKSQSTEK